jgi:hypothetical protein
MCLPYWCGRAGGIVGPTILGGVCTMMASKQPRKRRISRWVFGLIAVVVMALCAAWVYGH